MPGQDARAAEGDGATRVAPERHLAHRDGELLLTEFEQGHLGGLLSRKASAEEVTPGSVTAQGNLAYVSPSSGSATTSSFPIRPRRNQYQNRSEPTITVA